MTEGLERSRVSVAAPLGPILVRTFVQSNACSFSIMFRPTHPAFIEQVFDLCRGCRSFEHTCRMAWGLTPAPRLAQEGPWHRGVSELPDGSLTVQATPRQQAILRVIEDTWRTGGIRRASAKLGTASA